MDTQLRAWIADFLLDCQAAGLSPRTVAWYQSNLEQFQDFARQQRWVAVTARKLRAYVAHLRERPCYGNHSARPDRDSDLSAHSIAGHVRTFKRFFNWLAAEGVLDTNPGAALKPPRLPQAAPRGVALEDVARLLRAATNHAVERAGWSDGPLQSPCLSARVWPRVGHEQRRPFQPQR